MRQAIACYQEQIARNSIYDGAVSMFDMESLDNVKILILDHRA
jgi:hypothetical protein